MTKRWASFHRHQYREDTEMKFEVDVSDIHVHLHIKPDPEVLARLDAIFDRLDLISSNQETTMALIDDLQAKADATLVQVQRNSDLDDSIITIVTANAQTIKDLKAALDAAGTDPAKLQALSDTMDQIAAKATAEGQKTADAVTANTPAA